MNQVLPPRRADERAEVHLDRLVGRMRGVGIAQPADPRRRTRELGTTPPPLLTVVFRKGEDRLRFFSTITIFATPRDVTLDELQIECVFPADEATAEVCRSLATG